jgi:type IV secretory pathway TraG/TraD family ATPase VirD4
LILVVAVGLVVLYLGLQFAAALSASEKTATKSIVLVALDNFSDRIENHAFSFAVVPETGKVLGVCLLVYAIGMAYYFTTRKNLIVGKEHGTAKWGGIADIRDLFATNIEKKEIFQAKLESVKFLRGYFRKKAYRGAKQNMAAEKKRLAEELEEEIQDLKAGTKSSSGNAPASRGSLKTYKADRTKAINADVAEYYERQKASCWKPDAYRAACEAKIEEIKTHVLLDGLAPAERSKKIAAEKQKCEKKIAGYYNRDERVRAIRKRYKNADMLLTASERICMHNHKTNNNVLIVGGSGSGKTRGFVMPNILQAHSSYVVTDPKGEILEKAGHFLEVNGYKIRVLNLDDKSLSDYYNPFHYIHNDAVDEHGLPDVARRKGYEERVLSLIETIIVNTDGGEKKGGSDPFWDKAERLFLQAVFFFACDGFPPAERNMNTVLDLIAMLKLEEEHDNMDSDLDYFAEAFAADRGKEYMQARIEEIQGIQKDPEAYFSKKEFDGWPERQKEGHLADLARQKEEITAAWGDEEEQTRWGGRHIGVQQFKEFREKAAGKTAKSIVISAVARLAAFRTPEVRRIFSKDGMRLDRVGEEKTAIFVVVPPTDDTFNFIAGMLFTQLFQELQYCATQAHKHDGQRLPVPCRFILDEFANTCTIPNFVKILAYARSFGIGIVPILQSLEQIKNMYKDEWGVIVDNCSSFLFLGSIGHTDTLEYLSKRLGKATFDKRTLGHSYGSKGSSSRNFDVIGRDLMDSAELSKIPKSDCVLLVGGRNPFYSKKYEYTSHPNYRLTSDGDKQNSYCYTPSEPIAEEFGFAETYHGDMVSGAAAAAGEKYRMELKESNRILYGYADEAEARQNISFAEKLLGRLVDLITGGGKLEEGGFRGVSDNLAVVPDGEPGALTDEEVGFLVADVVERETNARAALYAGGFAAGLSQVLSTRPDTDIVVREEESTGAEILGAGVRAVHAAFKGDGGIPSDAVFPGDGEAAGEEDIALLTGDAAQAGELPAMSFLMGLLGDVQTAVGWDCDLDHAVEAGGIETAFEDARAV